MQYLKNDSVGKSHPGSVEGRTKYDKVREWFLRLLLRRLESRKVDLPSVDLRGNFERKSECLAVKAALELALSETDTLPEHVRQIEGMSGQKYRTFINTLVKLLKDPRYLEVGSWAGSTASAALYGNSAKATCIDNWSQFGGPKAEFFSNIEMVKSSAVDFRFLEADFRSVDYSSIEKYNIYLFDGPHGESDQYDGIMIARPALDRIFVLIVDDWNWRRVRIGTFRAFRQANFTILCSAEIRTSFNDRQPPISGKSSDWHNGYFIAVLSSPGSDRLVPVGE